MNAAKLLLAAAASLGVCACSNEYFERSDKIRFSAGDAVATNSAVQIPNPNPPRSGDTNIPMDGVKAQKAIEKYRAGDQKKGGGLMVPVIGADSNSSPYEPTINTGK